MCVTLARKITLVCLGARKQRRRQTRNSQSSAPSLPSASPLSSPAAGVASSPTDDDMDAAASLATLTEAFESVNERKAVEEQLFGAVEELMSESEDQLDALIETIESSCGKDFMLIGDNLDFLVKKAMSSKKNRNAMIHWFHLIGMRARARALVSFLFVFCGCVLGRHQIFGLFRALCSVTVSRQIEPPRR